MQICRCHLTQRMTLRNQAINPDDQPQQSHGQRRHFSVCFWWAFCQGRMVQEGDLSISLIGSKDRIELYNIHGPIRVSLYFI